MVYLYVKGNSKHGKFIKAESTPLHFFENTRGQRVTTKAQRTRTRSTIIQTKIDRFPTERAGHLSETER